MPSHAPTPVPPPAGPAPASPPSPAVIQHLQHAPPAPAPAAPPPGQPGPAVIQHLHHGHPVLWFLVLVLLLALVVLAVYVVIHLVRRPATGIAAAAAVSPDEAVDSVRVRYARGEIDREEFVRVSTDLGAPPPAPA